jgi:hypothetical protein
LLSAPGEKVDLVRGPALDLENEQNPLPHRPAKVGRWLQGLALLDAPDALLQARTAELIGLGFKNFDAFHLAGAELGGAEVFGTCDDRLLAAAVRHAAIRKVRVVNPIELAQKILA